MTRDEIIKQMGWPSNANSTISDLVDRVEAVVRKAEEAAAIRARRKQMTDRELLELAAKAAGMPYAGWQWSESDDDYMPWNPLDDDGDALRLAVRLKMAIGHYGCGTCEVVSIEGSVRCDEFNDTDSYAATRRAIVRAAAEIGRNMK